MTMTTRMTASGPKATETTTTATSAGPRALPKRQRQRPLALEDQLVLPHGFVPADRPAPPPAMTTTTRMTASRSKSDKGAGRRQHKSDINIINDHWTAGTTKRAVDKS
jgi:hypothetical protein